MTAVAELEPCPWMEDDWVSVETHRAERCPCCFGSGWIWLFWVTQAYLAGARIGYWDSVPGCPCCEPHR